jgi:RimJ/RimL family protein N-acetyltransferase
MHTIRPLKVSDEDNVYTYLEQAPFDNVMMMATLRDWGFASPHIRHFFGCERDGVLCGVASFARDVALYGDAEAMRSFGQLALARRPLPRRIISPAAAVAAFWETFQKANIPIRFDRRQPLYALTPTQLNNKLRCPELQEATLAETDLILQSSAAMNREELGIDPLQKEPVAFRSRVRGLIELGRMYRVLDSYGVAFQAAVYSQTPLASQIASVYTRPDLRGKGLATRAMAEVCRQRFRVSRACCLFVNDFNTPARRAYERVGFVQVGEFRAIFLDEDTPEP